MRKSETYSTARMLREGDYLAPWFRKKLLETPCPKRLCGVEIPVDLTGLTLDQLEDISLASGADLRAQIMTLFRVVLGVTDDGAILNSEAGEVCGFVRKMGEAMAQVSRLFAGITRPHTEDERAAGVERLNFGIFGLADWYARRMGISDHNLAKQTKWVRVYECARMDFLTAEYQRRLGEIRQNKMRQRNKPHRR